MDKAVSRHGTEAGIELGLLVVGEGSCEGGLGSIVGHTHTMGEVGRGILTLTGCGVVIIERHMLVYFVVLKQYDVVTPGDVKNVLFEPLKLTFFRSFVLFLFSSFFFFFFFSYLYHKYF